MNGVKNENGEIEKCVGVISTPNLISSLKDPYPVCIMSTGSEKYCKMVKLCTSANAGIGTSDCDWHVVSEDGRWDWYTKNEDVK